MEKSTVGRLRECAGAVLSHATLLDVRVSRLHCEGTTPVKGGPFEVESNLTVSATQDENTVHSYAFYDVRALSEETAAWSVKLEMVGTWSTDEGTPKFDEEHLTCFSIAIGMMTLHPYARETIQSAVSRMGYPPFTMDLMTAPTAGADDDVVEISAADTPGFD